MKNFNDENLKENRSNFGEIDVAPAKNDKVEKFQKLTAGLNPNHMHIFMEKRCAKLHKDRHEIV